MKLNPTAVVEKFWHRMASNDFDSVADVLSEDFVLEWPQSNERIRGAANFAQMNREYPANGRWQFEIHRIVSNDHEAASDVSVSDGVQFARALSFFTVRAGQIVKIVEYWPEPYPAPPGRAHLVERMK
jgi:ketosteroid isomerase-like protein